MADAIQTEDIAAFMDRLESHFMAARVPQAMQEAVVTVQESFRKRFDSQSAPDGSAWPARKPPTGGWPLLNKTGALKDAATGAGAGAIAESGDKFATVGINKSVNQGGIPGAAVHNFGFPERNIPQREFIGVEEPALLNIEEMIADELEAGMP